MIILVVIALAAAVLAYVSYPLWAPAESKPAVATTAPAKSRSKSGAKSTPRPSLAVPQPPTRASMQADLADAEELELDRQSGRLAEADYAALREGPAGAAQGRPEERDEDEIERRVRALRQERARRGPRPSDEDRERQ